MKPKLQDGKLTVSLHMNERQTLIKALEIGMTLIACSQETGKALVAAVTAILGDGEPDESGKTE